MQGKVFDKMQHPLIVNTLNKLGIKGNFLHPVICEKPSINNILNGERLNIFSLRLGGRQGCLSPHLSSTSPKKKEEKEGRQDGRKKYKLRGSSKTVFEQHHLQ